MSDLTLVAGSTGNVGGKICDLLASQRPRRAGARPADVRPGEGRAAPRARRRSGRRRHRAARDARAGGGGRDATSITTASTFPADQRPNAIDIVERGGTCNLVDAAAAAGVRRFVHVSLLETPTTYPHQQAKLAAEAYLKPSGLEYAIVKPGLFADVWFSPMLGFDVDGGTVQIFGDGTATPLPGSAATTWPRFVVWALDADEARNASIELGGPDAVSQLDVVELHEELLGQRLERRYLPRRSSSACTRRAGRRSRCRSRE